MRLITNEKLVTRNARIGKYAQRLGFIMLLAAMVINFYSLANLSHPDFATVTYLFAFMLLAIVLSTVGNVYQLRWGQRPDRELAETLKGLDDRYTLYNYRLGAAHVLTCPAGVIVLVPNYRPGKIEYRQGKWQGSKRNPLIGFFAPDPLGNPSLDAAAEVESLMSFLKKHAPEISVAPTAVIVFLHPRAEISAEEAPLPALHAKQLKDYIRRLPKSDKVSVQALADLAEKMGW